MLSSKPLCARCKQINFGALRGPSASDIEHLTTSTATGERFAGIEPGSNQAMVGLGTLSRIRKDAPNCPLCGLFHQIISRQGAIYRRGLTFETLDNADIEFRADPDLSYFARIMSLDAAGTENFVIRRLNITAYEANAPDRSIAYFDNVIQVCDVGTVSGSLRYPSQTHGAAAMMPFGGRKRPLRLDIQFVLDWMHICADDHERRCELTPSQVDRTQVDTIRLINVHQRSIQEVYNVQLAELKFIALSYVWGSAPMVRLLKKNKTALQKPGSFHELRLPQTIADSMELVDQLGFKYLWVDALCIVQDDPDDQSQQIAKMATVYSSAFLTIVAASGDDANAGLPGFGSSNRLYEQQEVMVLPPTEHNDGLAIMNTLKAYPSHWDEWYTRCKEDVDASKWSQRAWTMQEKALSRRTLVFTSEQVFWSCQQAYFCEESYFEVPRFRIKHFYPSVHASAIHQLTDPNVDLWKLYKDLIHNYMLRDLTYEGDVHVACQGILDAMGKSTKPGFLWGLPLSRFELALAWESFHGVGRRTALSTFPMTSLKKRTIFPTWSWMGWTGDVHCGISDVRRESETSVIVCFIHRKKPLRFHHVTPKAGGLTGSDLWTNSDIQREEVAVEQLKEQLPNLTEEALAQWAEESLLFFWTHLASFRVVYAKTSGPASSYAEYAGQIRPVVEDAVGNVIGSVCKTTAAGSDSRFEEFVAIGRRQIGGIPESLAEEICPPAILALQVERDQYGVCSRVNYAEIDLKAWMRGESKRSLIALQ